MAQTTLDQRMLGVGTALTDHTITASLESQNQKNQRQVPQGR